MSNIAAYVRPSTEKQRTQHQIDSIEQWLDDRDLEMADIDLYAEAPASGADEHRDEFNDLLDSIKAGKYGEVVVWELSRIARKGLLAQEFFDACEDAETTIHVTNGSIRKLEPDGHGRLIADIIAAVAAEERRNLVRRTKAGIQRAKDEGKWVGRPPAGFVTVDGQLRPNLNPDYDDGEVGFLDVQDAVEQVVEDGESKRSVAKQTPNITRQGLSKIINDEDRRQWYLDLDLTIYADQAPDDPSVLNEGSDGDGTLDELFD